MRKLRYHLILKKYTLEYTAYCYEKLNDMHNSSEAEDRNKEIQLLKSNKKVGQKVMCKKQ